MNRPEAAIFGNRLRGYRAALGMSQAEVAGAVTNLGGRLTANYVSDLERGLKAPTLTMILKLSRVLNVSVAELLADFTPDVVRKLRLE
jgi:transcriptional regulator with XRE-family HTH domain